MNIPALLAGLFSGVIGAMGLGGGAVLIMYLSLFTDTKQLTAQGINLLFFIPIALVSVIVYSLKKKIKWKTVIIFAISGLLGTFLGWWLAGIIKAQIITKIFGGVLVIFGIKEIFTKRNKNSCTKN